jgi:uncharacterized protein (TIGR02266 family)
MPEARDGHTGNTQQDRRRALRSPLIVLRARLESDRKTFFGYAKNISRGGMFIASVSPASPGSRFQVEFPLPGRSGSQVRCSCEVVWNRLYSPKDQYEPGMGLRFLDLPSPSAEAIDSWANSAD